jgi:hypothetical protein
VLISSVVAVLALTQRDTFEFLEYFLLNELRQRGDRACDQDISGG